MSPYLPTPRFIMAIVTCAALAGCAGSTQMPSTAQSPTTAVVETSVPTVSATAAPPSIAEIRASLARPANAKPYSATVETRSLVEGEEVMVIGGRMNLNSPLSGHLKFRFTEPGGDGKFEKGEMLITRQEIYQRAGDPAGKWRRLGSTELSESQSPTNFDGYARLLLKRGPAAIKGQRSFKGIPATRISGQVKTTQIKDIDPYQYRKLRKADVDDFDVDLWVDHEGRAVRLEQRFVVQELKFQKIVTLAEFRGPYTFKAPTS